MKHPGSITLLDVRSAVHEGSPFSMGANQPNPACPVGRNIQAAFSGVYSHAARAMEAEGGTVSVLTREAGRR